MESLPAIRDAVDQIRAGRLAPVDLVEHCLGRIHQFEDRIHAWALVDEQGARSEAERLTRLAGQGEIVGPLHGVPIGVKDIIDVAGMPTRCGSPLRENAPPAMRDAPVVANLRQAGAIILGKTVTTEWACFDPPPTRNPWNLDHTPGGSSSGSAAAVAMEMCMAALGTQTGGSIIRPAAYCGVCGLKPTSMFVKMQGIAPVSVHLDHVGPLARSASDMLAVFEAIGGRNWPPRYDEVAPKLGLLKSFFLNDAEPDVKTAFEPAWRRIAGAAESVQEIDLPTTFDDVFEHHWRIMSVEAAEVHREAFEQSPSHFGPKIRALIETGRSTHVLDYVASLRHFLQFKIWIDSLLPDETILAMPATNTTAPGTETTGDARFNLPWSYSGRPAVTLPCGLSRDGLPIGLQLVAPIAHDLPLLHAAAWCERQLAFDAMPPLSASWER